MADQELQDLDEAGALDDADLVYVLQDPAGTPAPKKAPISALREAVGGASGEGSAGELAHWTGAPGTTPVAPSIAAAASSSNASSVTSHVITLPSGIVAGQLLIAAISAGAGGVTEPVLTWPAGWTALSSTYNSSGSSHVKVEIRYRIADGTEGANITITSNGNFSAHGCYLISDWHGTTPPEAGVATQAASGMADPPSLAPSWATEDTLFIAIGGVASGSNIFTGFPTSYSLNQLAPNGNNIHLGMAGRKLSAASDDPSAFTNPSAPQIAQTIAVRGTPALTEAGSELTTDPDLKWNAADKRLEVNGVFAIKDGVTEPGTVAGVAQIFVDIADGDLKVKYGDGTVKLIVVDT